MFKWIKKCINKAVEFDKNSSIIYKEEELTVDVAKANYQKYCDDLKKERSDYIKSLCSEIKIKSRNGAKFIETVSLLKDFMTYDYMINELKPYFESRGFKVTEEDNNTGVITSWLRISWED